MASSSRLLSIDGAAQELGAPTPLAIRRLIARNVLAAQRVGERLVVIEDDLVAYVRSGAPDFDMPPVDDRAGWLAGFDKFGFAPGRFRQAVRDAAADQRLSDAQFRDALNRDPSGRQITVTLELTPQIREVLNASPRSLVQMPNQQDPPFETNADLFIADRLRRAALKVIRADGPAVETVPEIERLYESRGAYDAIVSKAIAAVAAESISDTEQRAHPSPGFAPRTISYELPLASIRSQLTGIARATF